MSIRFLMAVEAIDSLGNAFSPTAEHPATAFLKARGGFPRTRRAAMPDGLPDGFFEVDHVFHGFHAPTLTAMTPAVNSLGVWEAIAAG